MAIVFPLVKDLSEKRGYRFFLPGQDTLPGASGHPTPSPYDAGVAILIPDEHWLICMDPEISGSNTLTILGNGQLYIP